MASRAKRKTTPAAVASAPVMPSELVYRPLAKLLPYASNSRTHSDDQVQQIIASIKEFGWTNPVLIEEEGGIIAGHGRVLAAQKLAIPEVPCIVLAHLTPAQKRAYVIADNKLALNAGWDEELLAVELAELQDLGFDVELTGFSLDEIGKLLADDAGGLGPGGDAPTQRPAESWAVIVDCADEADQVALIERMQAEGRKVRGSIG